VLSVVPFAPLASVEPFQVYLLPAFAVRLMLSPPVPAVLAVNVTVVVPPELAVTPAATGHRLIAAARFVARVVVLELVAKVPAVELPHAFEPFVPAVTPLPHEKMLPAFDNATEKAETLVVPLVVFVTVTVLVLVLALTPAAAGHSPIAAARLEARVVVLELVAKVPLAALGHVFVPALPPVTLPHKKMPVLFVAPAARNGPGLVWVMVTVLVLDPAVTPTPAGHRPIAVATLAARLVVLPSVAKVPLVALPQKFVPFVPAVTGPHVKIPVLFAVPAEKAETVKSPFVVLVTVTVLLLNEAVAPTAEFEVLQALIAAARFVARVVVFELVTNVPAVEVVHVCVPLAPAVKVPHEKPVRVFAIDRKFPGFASVTTTVLPLGLAVTPTVSGNALLQALIAAARFVARSDVAAAVMKVPLVEDGQVCVPLVPAVTPLQE
jgi:hypothetical protein